MISTSVKKFGVTKNNEEVLAYTLKNSSLEVVILDYGGIIQKILMEDRDGRRENIVLGFDSVKDYEERSPHFGAIIGRTAGRIKKGELLIEDKIYNLEKNNFENNLHGYPEHFGNKMWKGEMIHGRGEVVLRLSRRSPHMEGHYPGNVDFTINYILNENKLTIEYIGIPDRKTYVNLTNHTYFNLSGECKEDIGNQIITLSCDEFVEVDSETLPIGIRKVDRTLFDLREGRRFNEVFDSSCKQSRIVNNGIDHPFVFNEKKYARCYDEKTGRLLEVETTEPVVVLYTGNYLDEVGKISNGVLCKKHLGFCLETQDYPDVAKFTPEKSRIYTKNKNYYQKTTFIFSVYVK